MTKFHNVCIHPNTYTSKPVKFAGYISAQIASHPKKVTIEQLAKDIGLGKSWTPGTFLKGKRSIETFNQMSLLSVDIDKWNVELEEIKRTAQEHDLHPCIIHESFSSSKNFRKWRVVFQLEQPLKNISDVYHCLGVLANIFNADGSVVEPARFLYGTTTEKVHIVNPEAAPIPLIWFNEKETLKIKTKKKIIKGDVRDKPRDRVYTSDLPILGLVIEDCKKLISDPPDSRYQALWNAARKLAQLDYFSYDQIMQAIRGTINQYPEIWDDWDKDVEKTIDNGIKWGVQHLREDIV